MNSAQIALREFERTLKKWMLISDTELIRIFLAAVIANRMEADPLWLFIIGPPSTAKTELIQALRPLPYIYPLSSLTPTTFASGYIGQEGSLLYKLNPNDILTFKDFTSILTMHREQQGAILGQMREIYDGHYNKTFGTGKVVKWEGKLGFIAGVTPIIDTHYSIFQTLGERFIQVRMRPLNEIRIAKQAIRNTGKEKAMRSEIAHRLCHVLTQVKIPRVESIGVSKSIEHRIASLAAFTVKGRSGVVRNNYTRDVIYVPEAEAPPRLAKQLILLAKALAVSRGATQVSTRDVGTVLRVALDSLPSERLRMIRTISLSNKPLSTSDISQRLHLPHSTTDRLLIDLSCHNVVSSNEGGGHKLWSLSKWTKMRLKGFLRYVGW